MIAAFMDVAIAARDQDIVYVRQPRYGDTSNTTWPEVFYPAALDPGADLADADRGDTARGRQPLAGRSHRVRHGDANSGIDLATLSVTANVPVAGRAAGVELRDLAVAIGDAIHAIDVGTPLAQLADARLLVSVRDRQGNRAVADVAFSVPLTADTLLRDGFE